MEKSSKKIRYKKGIKLWNRAKELIPGGNQLLSKRAEMFLPDQWPAYYKKAKGVEVWDLDGNKYVDMSYMSVGAATLGYADSDVNKAVARAVKHGSISTLNSPEEVELAELLLKLHPWAGMVRYARTGGESMAIAVRIARAYSGKDKVAFCGYHGWSDWYLSSNLSDNKNLDGHLLSGLEPAGVPRVLKGTSFPFRYNHLEDLKKIIHQHPDIGVIVMEPIRHHEPKKGFLEGARKIADKTGAVLVFDEISIGWRLNVGGAHMLYGVRPDIAVFAKAMSNGYPMAAIIGKKGVMQSAQNTFISSTYWTERIGPVAALTTIKKMLRLNVPARLKKTAALIGGGLRKLAQNHNLKITVDDSVPVVVFSFDYGERAQALKTLFTQEMLKRGFLATNAVYVSYAHKNSHIKKYFKAVDKVFGIIKKAAESEKPEKLLKGPVAHSGFKRLT